MTLFEAQEPDPRDEAKVKRRMRTIIVVVVLLAIGMGIGYHFRHWQEERTVDKFFNQIELKHYEDAYALWQADPQWKEHTDRYKQYPFGKFQLDWGPSGDYGPITSHRVDGAVEPKNSNGPVSGVVVKVTVNDRVQPACLWVEKKTKVISFSPRECQ